MAKVTSIDFDKAAVGELLRTPDMEADMVRRMEAVMAQAIAQAPVGGGDDPHRGRYKESFRLHHGLSGMPGARVLSDRAWATVENDAPEALFIEYGNKNIQRYHTLLIALLQAAGGAA
jgi:hypothetical protein